ncbi:MAG: TIGR03619 family F420-dependent LLM class oxidoreductase [Chloroflexota bacterium]|nr:TIGR03619 family F420-dependent LLM class oxidoreductase [Chloroflexota bacterium]
MKIGFTAVNVGNLAVPEIGRLAEMAEELGYESFWTAEHIILPDLPPGQAERPGDLPMLDPIAVLSYIAARTRTLKLATGVLLLPQHEPLLLAKQLASLDVLSNGRTIVGIGVGGVEAEAKAIGVPMSERGARATEYLEAMIALWSMDHPRYSGRYVSFEGINAYPRPIQQPHPPLVGGGRSEGALRRAVKYCSGWFGFAQTVEITSGILRTIQDIRQRIPRPVELGELEITANPQEPMNRETVEAYAALGVRRLLHRFPPFASVVEMEQILRDNAPSKLGL